LRNTRDVGVLIFMTPKLVPKRGAPLTIFVPVSMLSDVRSGTEKTIRIGQVARAAAIFRVGRIVVYRDRPSAGMDDLRLMRDVLSYIETPQYLRRRLFPISENLKYAGILPPLRTPHHPLALGSSALPYREGVTLKSGPGGSLVDVGLSQPVTTPSPLPPSRRVTLRLEDGVWQPISRDEVPYYWGYDVQVELKGLSSALSRLGDGDFVIATSRLGTPLSEPGTICRLREGLRRSTAVLFGSPSEGLHDILRREGSSIEDAADLTVNTVPYQGTATVRTEEAVMISLAALAFVECL